MMELTINGQVYQFNFGMGFLRDANKMVSTSVDGIKDVKKDIGARYMIARVIDGEPEALVDLLDVANKGQNPRVTKALLDSYIDDPDTDVDALFEDTLDFLGKANATKKLMAKMMEAIEEAREAQNKN
nr:tail assembly chaperone [uncultured Merdimonas sp.]